MAIKEKIYASAGNRTQINCLEGNYANRYTTDATGKTCSYDGSVWDQAVSCVVTAYYPTYKASQTGQLHS